MDRRFIGNNFNYLIQDMGEDYTLTTNDGEEYVGKMSIIAKTASSYMMAEREYLMNGVATFPNYESQISFRGCYFTRAEAPNHKYILVSTIPKDTTEYIAEVYATACNATVSLAYLKETMDEKFDTVITPEVYASDVDVYWDSSLQKQRRSSDGNFDQTLYYMQIPAKYGLAQEEIVLRRMPRYNEKLGKNEWIETRFRVEAIDVAMISTDEYGNVCGIVDVQMSLDTRG